MIRYKHCCNFPLIPAPSWRGPTQNPTNGRFFGCRGRYLYRASVLQKSNFPGALPPSLATRTDHRSSCYTCADFHFRCVPGPFLEKGPWSASASERRRPVSASVPASQCTPVTGKLVEKRLPTALMHPLAQSQSVSPFYERRNTPDLRDRCSRSTFFLSTPVATLT